MTLPQLPPDWVAIVRRASEGGAFDDVPVADFVQPSTGLKFRKRDPGEMIARIEALVGPPPPGFRFAYGYARALRGRGAFSVDGRGLRRALVARLEPLNPIANPEAP